MSPPAACTKWSFATFVSLTVNGSLFVLVSLLTRQSAGEREAARACCTETSAPLAGVVVAGSPSEFRALLASTLGQPMADREVDQALSDLGDAPARAPPTELRRLRERIERNLSGLLGTATRAHHRQPPPRTRSGGETALADSLRHVEDRLRPRARSCRV